MTEISTRPARPVLPNQAEDMKAAYPFPDGGPVALVDCRSCEALPGEACTTASGGPVRGVFHAKRVDAYNHARRSRVMRMVLCIEDDRFGLSRGDILLCVAYPLDAKVTVLYRESDGFEPECNQYSHDVRLIDFTTYNERTLTGR